MRAFTQKKGLNPELAEALYELGNVGVGKATSALGDMLGRRITIATPQVFSVGAEVSDLTGLPPDSIVMGILMQLAENLGGAVMILINKDFMSDLIFKLTGVNYSDDMLINDEDSLSTIQEVANIMAASYMTAIGAYTGLRIYLSPVMVGVDMVAALVAYPLAQMSLSGDSIICIDTSFNVMSDEQQPQRCDGRIIMMPDEHSVDVLMQALHL